MGVMHLPLLTISLVALVMSYFARRASPQLA
jgi:hypothetical protein